MEANNKKDDVEAKEEEDEKQNKTLCVSVTSDNCARHWFAIDPRVDSELVPGREIMEMTNHHIDCLDRIVRFGVVVLDSKIYYLGGAFKARFSKFSNKVYIFDTITSCWSEGPPMNQARCSVTFAGAIGRKIYVFGTLFGSSRYRVISEENWGECYDIDSQLQQWHPISAPIDTRPDFLSCDTDAAVVYGDDILFWSRKIGIYAYNHRDQGWNFVNTGFVNDGPEPCLNFVHNHIVIGDFALWQYYGDMYAWDLKSHHTFFIWTLPGPWFAPPLDWDDYDPYPGPSNLVHVGNGMLCFLRWRFYRNKPNINCYRLKIKGSIQSGGKTCHLGLEPIGRQFYDVPGDGFGIRDAFTL